MTCTTIWTIFDNSSPSNPSGSYSRRACYWFCLWLDPLLSAVNTLDCSIVKPGETCCSHQEKILIGKGGSVQIQEMFAGCAPWWVQFWYLWMGYCLKWRSSSISAFWRWEVELFSRPHLRPEGAGSDQKNKLLDASSESEIPSEGVWSQPWDNGHLVSCLRFARWPKEVWASLPRLLPDTLYRMDRWTSYSNYYPNMSFRTLQGLNIVAWAFSCV